MPLSSGFRYYPCRHPVAYYVRFMPPSKEAVMGVIRVCILRHHRYPDITVVDNGKDLLGIDCQQLAAKLRREFWIRPPHEARSGSIIEAGNRSLDSHLLHNIPGSTKGMKRVRQVTKGVNPWNLPMVAMADLQPVLDEYIYEIIPNTIHPELLMTPQNKMNEGMKLLGERENTRISYDEELHLLTMPFVPGETCRVQAQGIKFNHTYYSSPLLQSKIGQDLRTRLDPMDQAHVYSEVDGRYIEVRSRQTAEFLACQTYSRELASALVRAKKGHATTLRNKRIAAQLQPHIEKLHEKAALPGHHEPPATAQTQATPPPGALPAPSPLSPTELVAVPVSKNFRNLKPTTELETVEI